MKYWRGYLTAAVLAIFSWALTQFASAHSKLLDMVYPYVTRVLQTGLAQWSGSAEFCVWQVLLLFGIFLVLASVVLMVTLRWNPVQWFGWVLAGVMLVNFLSTGLYGLNMHTSSIAEDMHIGSYNGSEVALEDAAVYYLQKANELSSQVRRDSSGAVSERKFEIQATQAADGFETLVKQQHYPVFAGSTQPVKVLGWSNYYTEQGVTGKTVGLTGEAAVNPQVPAVGMPFAICKEMSKRMSITRDSDASFAAYMACAANKDVAFQYSGWLMAYRYCYKALQMTDSSDADAAVKRLSSQMNNRVTSDLKTYDSFVNGSDDAICQDTAQLLLNWHIESVVIPAQIEEEELDKVILFDPLDESDPRLSDLLEPATEG